MPRKNNNKYRKKGRVSNNIQTFKHIEPKTEGQREYILEILENDVIFCIGPCGSGKTACAAGVAAELLVDKKVEKIVLTRPIVSAGTKKFGALPGDIGEKLAPYLVPLVEELRKFLGQELYYKFIREGKIVVEPLELLRGRNFHNCFMILDEAQNAEFDDIVMFISRMGNGSKVCINGDIRQSDLYRGTNVCVQKIDLEILLDNVEDANLDGFSVVELTEDDMVRNKKLAAFLRAVGK